MNGNADRLLREAVHELAGAPHPPVDLAATAIRRGRQIRRRRQACAVAAALVAVGAIAAPYVWLRPDPEPPAESVAGPPAASPADTPSPVPATPAPKPTRWDGWTDAPLVLPGGLLLASATSASTPGMTWVYDRTRGRYVDLSTAYRAAWAAPQGRLAAVRQDGRPGETGLLDISSGKVQWVRTSGAILTPQWSPDGKRLLITVLDKVTGNFSIGILSATSRSFRQYPVKSAAYECTDRCQFTWLPNGKEVALPLTDPTAPRSEFEPHLRRGLQLFAATGGTPTRFLPVRGNVSGPAAWSPDGSLVVVAGQSAAQLVSVDTGRVVRELPTADVTWIGDDRLLYLDSRLGPDTASGGAASGTVTAVLVDTRGTEIERAELPDELFGIGDVLVAPR